MGLDEKLLRRIARTKFTYPLISLIPSGILFGVFLIRYLLTGTFWFTGFFTFLTSIFSFISVIGLVDRYKVLGLKFANLFFRVIDTQEDYIKYTIIINRTKDSLNTGLKWIEIPIIFILGIITSVCGLLSV